jgi:hypothetical protein
VDDFFWQFAQHFFPSAWSRSRTVCQLAVAGLAAYAGGSTLLARAHAHRSSTVVQQQCVQQSSALRQPQGLFSQGKRWEWSLAAGAGMGKPSATVR